MRSSVNKPQPTPPVPPGVMIVRFLVAFPVPHSLLQVPQLPHADIWQLAGGHPCVLHSRRSFSSGQGVPSCVGCCQIERSRCDVPPSQDLLHGDHSVQDSTAQSTRGGQASVLHARCSERAPHVAPLCLASSMIVLERTWWPPPHSAVQLLNAVHSLILQSTATQPSVLHSRDSVSAAQVAPPGELSVVI